MPLRMSNGSTAMRGPCCASQWPLQATSRWARPARQLTVAHAAARHPSSSKKRAGAPNAASATKAAPAAPLSPVSALAAAQGAQQPSARARRQAKPRQLSAEAMQLLAHETGLMDATLHQIRALFEKGQLNADGAVLLARVLALQELLGADNAQNLINGYPKVLRSRPETLAANVEAWALFLPHLTREELLRKLSTSSTMIARRTRTGAPHLLNIAEVLGVPDQDQEDWAQRNSGMVSMSCDTVKQNVEAVADVLQSFGVVVVVPGQSRCIKLEHGEQELLQSYGSDVLQFVQRLAQRHQRWLHENEVVLRERLQGLHALLQPHAAAAGMEAHALTLQVFARAPNLLAYPTATLAHRATSFLQLPGLGSPQAVAVMLAIPTLLQIDPACIASRWAAIRAAASSFEGWELQLSNYAPATIASMLLKGDSKFARMAWVVVSGYQERIAFSSALGLDDKTFARRFPEYAASNLHHQMAQG